MKLFSRTVGSVNGQGVSSMVVRQHMDPSEVSCLEFKGLVCVFSPRKHSCLDSGME